jgi:hypothetical protein
MVIGRANATARIVGRKVPLKYCKPDDPGTTRVMVLLLLLPSEFPELVVFFAFAGIVFDKSEGYGIIRVEGVGVIVSTTGMLVSFPLIVVASIVVMTRPGVVIYVMVDVIPPVVVTYGGAVEVMVATRPPPRSVVYVLGGGVTVICVPPRTVIIVSVTGMPGVVTAKYVTGEPPIVETSV